MRIVLKLEFSGICPNCERNVHVRNIGDEWPFEVMCKRCGMVSKTQYELIDDDELDSDEEEEAFA